MLFMFFDVRTAYWYLRAGHRNTIRAAKLERAGSRANNLAYRRAVISQSAIVLYKQSTAINSAIDRFLQLTMRKPTVATIVEAYTSRDFHRPKEKSDRREMGVADYSFVIFHRYDDYVVLYCGDV